MKSAPGVGVRAAVTALKAVAIAVLLTVLAVGVVTTSVGDHSHTAPATDESPIAWENERVEQLMAQHRCSVTGFGNERTPGSALVRLDGAVHHVSFDKGWAVFTGKGEGTLVAVCLDTIGATGHAHDHGALPAHRH